MAEPKIKMKLNILSDDALGEAIREARSDAFFFGLRVGALLGADVAVGLAAALGWLHHA